MTKLTMPTPKKEECNLCGEEMEMNCITYSCEDYKIKWKCLCGALLTTEKFKECKMSETNGNDVKLCIDCKHYTHPLDCKRVSKGKSLIDGKIEYELAEVQREYPNWWVWRCGKKGRFWEKKEK